MADAKEKKSRLLGAGEIGVSFEFFPPKTEKMEELLWASINRLAPLAPEFVSVTYGAGGSTRERTHTTVARIVKETALRPAAHLTCVNATKDEVDEVARAYWAAGVRRWFDITQFPDRIHPLPDSVAGESGTHPESASLAASGWSVSSHCQDGCHSQRLTISVRLHR